MKPLTLSASQRSMFKQCQKKWWYAYMDNLEPVSERSAALWFGIGIHLAMEKYYIPGTKRGTPPWETWAQYCADTRKEGLYISVKGGSGEEDVYNSVDALKLGDAMLRHYVDFYGPEEHIEVISPELPFNVSVPHMEWQWNAVGDAVISRLEPFGFFRGVMDLTFRDLRDGTLWVKDYKTCSSLGYGRNQFLPLDDQAGAYYAIAEHFLHQKGLIKPDEHLRGVIYDYLVKRAPDIRPRNQDGLVCNKPLKADYIAALAENGQKGLDKLKLGELQSLAEQAGIEVFGKVSKNQPTPTLERVKVYRSKTQLKTQIQRIKSDMEAISLVRNGIVPVSKNPTKDCAWCPFNELCILDEDGRQDEKMKNLLYRIREEH